MLNEAGSVSSMTYSGRRVLELPHHILLTARVVANVMLKSTLLFDGWRCKICWVQLRSTRGAGPLSSRGLRS